MATIPRYEHLPDGLSWGVFGRDDQLGTINFLTPERIVRAARLVQSGEAFNLDLPLDVPVRTYGTLRHPPSHRILELRGGKALDDVLEEFFPQFSSQWDGLSHATSSRHGFYNGVRREEITGEKGTKLGIEHWAEHGIIGRGVLLDVAQHVQQRGQAIEPTSRFLISTDLLEETAAAQGTQFEPGDILLIRTGVAGHLLREFNSGVGRAPLEAGFEVPGLEPSLETVAWLWDRQFAAVAADNFAVEAWPYDSEDAFMHATLIPDLGLALGELFNFEQLAECSRKDGRYDCLFVASPLNLRGGVGSPANALAIR